MYQNGDHMYWNGDHKEYIIQGYIEMGTTMIISHNTQNF